MIKDPKHRFKSPQTWLWKYRMQSTCTNQSVLRQCFFFFLTGLELTFYSGVYGTCIGAMTRFGDNAKSLIGLSGIFIGVGEILGRIVWVFY